MTNVVRLTSNTHKRFVVSSSNRLAYTMAMETVEKMGSQHFPLLICGGVGTGKTFLLQTLQRFLATFLPERKVKVIGAETLKSELIRALVSFNLPEFHREYENLDVLMIDDFQFLAGHENLEKELIQIFDHINAHEGVLIVTADRPPEEFKEIHSELCELLLSNQIVAMETADDELKRQVLQNKIYEIAPDKVNDKEMESIIDYLTSKESYHLRRLIGSLTRVIRMGELMSEEIDLNFAKKIIG